MKIKDFFNKPEPSLSIEFFPPKSDKPMEILSPVLDQLEGLDINFISVTYGAGGSSKGNSLEIASRIKNDYNIEVMSHLTGVCCDEKEMAGILMSLKDNNIENILALRGDYPQGFEPGADYDPCFRYSQDLVDFVKSSSDFCIAGAAYPEGHPQCTDMCRSVEHLKMKVDSGVDFLVTQLFFDNDNFYRFIESIRKAGINVPVSAGIMPILNAKQIIKITSLCGAVLPNYILKKMEKFENDPQAVEELGIEFATNQIQNLLDNGVDGIHLYSMNKAESTLKILNNIRISTAV